MYLVNGDLRMRLDVEISLDCKIEDLFKGIRFEKFCEYCRTNGIVYLRQLESIDFVMFKSSMNVSDEEKNNAKEYWRTLIDIANGTLKQEDYFCDEDDMYSEIDTCEDQSHISETNSENHDDNDLEAQVSDWGYLECFEESQIVSLITRVERYFSSNRSFIPVDSCDEPVFWEGLTDSDIQIINKNPNLFYKCSAKRFVLVKWIIDEINCLFKKNGGLTIDINSIYFHLGEFFGVSSFNRENLRKLLCTVDTLKYSDFKDIKEKYLSDYYRILGIENTRDDYSSKEKFVRGSKPIALTLEIKRFLNNTFEEELYDISSEIDDISNNEIDIETHNRIIAAKEDLGKDICVWCIRNIEGTIAIASILQTYIKSHEEIKTLRNKLSQLISSINLRNYDARVSSLIMAAKIDNSSKANISLLCEKAKIICVSELNQLLSLPITHKDYMQLMNFIKWLCQDIRRTLKDELNKLFKSDKAETVIKRRASGATLEETGKELDLTRERIRQIEKKFHNRFGSYVARLNPHLILNAFSENSAYIKVEEISNVYDEMTEVFIYCLKECNCSTALWADQLCGFVVGEVSWYEKVKECLDELPDMIEMSEVDSLANNIAELTKAPMNLESIKSVILNQYTLSGKVYLRKKMRISQIYLAVLEKYYSDGIKLYDAFEAMRFRGYVKEMFGDVSLPDNNRAIDSVISRLTVLCDRGKYIIPSKINIPMGLLERIRDYINKSDRSIIMFAELFERFKNELIEKSNVTNRYFLQGVLKYYYPNDYYYTRDTLNKDNNSEASIRIAIEEFVKQEGRAVSKDELKEEFAGVSDAVLTNAYLTTPNLIVWDFGQYIHSSALKIDEDDYNNIRSIIQRNIGGGFVTSRKLFDILYMVYTEFLTKNNIHNHYSLFSVLMYMFKDEFEFRRPYICKKGNIFNSLDKILRDYVNQRNIFKITELKNFCDEMQIKIMNFEALLEELRDEFIRVDIDTCVRKNTLNLTQDLIEKIDEITSTFVINNGYISLRKINDFFYYPDLGVEWTQFLLESIIYEYSNKFKIIKLDYRDYRYVSGIIVDRKYGIDTYEEVLRHALKTESEHMPFKSIDEVEKWLKDQELILKSIPKTLFDRGIISQNEYGDICIQ